VAACFTHNLSAPGTVAPVTGGIYSPYISTFKTPAGAGLCEPGTPFHLSGPCCLPCRLLKGASAAIPTSPYPFIEQKPKQSLMVRDAPRKGQRVLPGGLIVGVTGARLKALYKIQNGRDVGHGRVGWFCFRGVTKWGR